MKLYELLAEEDDDLIMALSLVENPAIMASWVYFSADGKKEEIKFATVDEDKKIIVAPVLIPDLKILRIDENTGENYNVYLSAATIEKLSQNYLINGFQKKATLEHDANIDGEVSVVESWVSKSQTKDKSALYFNRTFPIGTWFVTFKVLSDKLWNDYIKTGKVKAVSIEGLLSHKLVKASSHIDLSKEISELTDVEADIVLSQISALFESYTDYGDEIKNNAKRGIELNEKNGNKCATQVGKVRAQQLADGEPISVETIKRMYSYLSRAETYYDESDMNSCGSISFLLWGGKSALSWSRNKLSELGLLEEAEANPSIPNSSYPGQAAKGKNKYIAPALFVEAPNLDVLGYETKYFQICPMAQKTFSNLLGMDRTEDTTGMIRSAAVVADAVFKIENDVLSAKKTTPQQLNEAIVLVEDYKDIIHEIDEEYGIITDVSYMDGHIETIKSFLSE